MESTLINKCLIRASKLGYRIFRQNVGLGWAGKSFKATAPMAVQLAPGDVVIRQARPFRAGLCTDSSDMVGWRSVVVCEKMLGKKIAIFVGLEAKSTNEKTKRKTPVTPGQKNWLEKLEADGGIAKVVYSENDVPE